MKICQLLLLFLVLCVLAVGCGQQKHPDRLKTLWNEVLPPRGTDEKVIEQIYGVPADVWEERITHDKATPILTEGSYKVVCYPIGTNEAVRLYYRDDRLVTWAFQLTVTGGEDAKKTSLEFVERIREQFKKTLPEAPWNKK